MNLKDEIQNQAGNYFEMVKWSDNLDPNMWYYVAVQEATNSHELMDKDQSVPELQFTMSTGHKL